MFTFDPKFFQWLKLAVEWDLLASAAMPRQAVLCGLKAQRAWLIAQRYACPVNSSTYSRRIADIRIADGLISAFAV